MKQHYKVHILKCYILLILFGGINSLGLAQRYSIAPFPNQLFCSSSYPTAYNTVNFALNETNVTGFNRNQNNVTMILTLPAGFQFNPAAGTISFTAARGITSIVLTSVTTTAITITVTTNNNNTLLDTIYFKNFQIRASAAGAGSLTRTGGTMQVGNATTNPTAAESFGYLSSSPAMILDSSVVSQYTIAPINRQCSQSEQVILRIKVCVKDTCPATITQFNFSTNGDAGASANPLTNITRANLFFGGNNSIPLIDATTPLFGTVASPNGAFTISGSQQLLLGTGSYYFYLTYDVPVTANIGDQLDASLNSFVFNGSTITTALNPNPTGTRTIISTVCNTPDMPGPPANLVTVPGGSYVIPMDNTNQSLVAPFNVKAYGLVHELLMNDVPVKWVILSGKAKDAADFTANASRVFPTVIASAPVTFKASAFIIDTTWLNTSFYSGGLTALQVIAAFNARGSEYAKVAIYKLTSNTPVNVRYTLDQRPKIACFNNGTYEGIATKMLDSAGITNYVTISAGVFPGLSQCFTFCCEEHWDVATNPPTAPATVGSITQKVWDFVYEGGNFFAQCAGVNTYENLMNSPQHFHSTNGVIVSNSNTVATNAYYSSDMAFMQFEGNVVANNTGTGKNWVLNRPGASKWVNSFYHGLSDNVHMDTIVAAAGHFLPADSVGGNVFYLGGHDYANGAAEWGNITYVNAIRMFLNATLVPATRPTAFTLAAGAARTICNGTNTTLGGSPTGPTGTTYNWSPSASLNNANSANPVATPTVTTTYTVVAQNGGCPGGPSYVTVTVTPLPAAPTASSNSPVCVGSALNLAASTIATATYSWTGPNTFTSAVQNPTIASATVAAAGTYSVKATVNGCTGPAGTTAVVVNATPGATTASNGGPICAGNTLTLATPTVAGATYSWTGPNAFTSALQNPSISAATTAATGTYSVTVTVGGCTSVAATTAATVTAVPAAPAPTSNSPICAGSTLTLATATVATATYSWTGPNGFTSTLQNPSITAATTAATGTYSVIVTVNGCASAAGTVAATVSPITATPVPTSNSPICAGSTLTLATATVATATYSWTGPNGFTSTLQNPSIAGATIAATGTYSVTVTVGGCASAAGTIACTVTTIPATPAPGSNTPVCTGNSINLTTATVATATYSWTGPNGFTSTVQNPSIAGATAAAAGTYSVTVTVNGCSGSAGTTAVVINPTPATPAPSSNSPICAGSTLTLATATVATATYSWTGPNGFTSTLQNPSIAGATVAATGTYSVIVTVGGCASAAGTIACNVNSIPATPAPGSNSPVCIGNSINLTTATVATATYSWTGPNGFASTLQNPTIAGATASAAGTYSVTITVNGCSGSSGTTAVVINPTPATPAPSSNSPVCIGATISLSTSAVATATYSWTGPNGFTSTLQNPSIASAVAASGGTYSLTITVNGCPGAAGTTAVIVSPVPSTPVASNNSPICVGDALNLTSNLIAGATYSWTGPNGFTSTLQNPSIAVSTALATGTYSVSVNIAGCQGSAGTTYAAVNSPPAAPVAGSNSPVCTGNTINLTASTIAGATYTWTGPNGFTSTLQNPSIAGATAAAAGTYTVNAIVNGCTGAAGTTSVIVNPTPATPTPTSNSPICVGVTLTFATATVATATYSWTGPNGFTSTLQNPSIAGATTSATGSYQVMVTVGSCTSAPGIVSATINSAPATPVAGSNTPVCASFSINLIASTIAGATYSWTGPNGFSSTLQNPTVAAATAAAAGTYTVTTNNGCASTPATTSVTILPTPATPAASNDGPVCDGSNIDFSTPAVGGATYSWTGPNGFTSTTQNPTITAATPAATGTYSVTITSGGCTSLAGTTAAVINAIPSAPVVSSNSPVCIAATISLSANTIAGASYSWTGPNGFTSTLQNPTIASAVAADSGTYSVTITVNNCTGPAGTTAVVVSPVPPTPVASSNSPVCSGNTINLQANTIASATYSWTGPNGFTSSLQNPTITNAAALNAGTYSVSVNIAGCQGAAGTTAVIINPTPATPVAGSNSPICAGSTLTLTTTPVATATYSWTGPNGFTDVVQNTSIAAATVAASGIYSVVVNVNGCPSAPGTISATVNPIPTTPSPTSNTPVCTGNAINLQVGALAGATYSWTGPNGFTSTLQNPSIASATTLATGTYSVMVSVSGCGGAAASTAVVVNPTPATPTANNDGPVCAGSNIDFTTPVVATATYAWSGPNGFSSTTQNPTIVSASAAATGTYSIVVTVNGCPSAAGTTAATINAIPATPAPFSNSPVCFGSTLNESTSAIAGASYSWTGPNGFTSTLQSPSIAAVGAAAGGTYSVTITVNGCSSQTGTDSVIINPLPLAPLAGSNSPVCSGSTVNLTASNIAGATYSWSGPNGFTSLVQNAAVNNVPMAGAGTYTVVAIAGGCAGPGGTTSVVVKATPVAPAAANNGPICAGTTLSLTSALVPTATYSWTGPNGFISSAQDTSIANATATASGTYAVAVTINGCTSAPGTTAATVYPIPAPPVAGSNSPLCVGSTIQLSANAIIGASYTWTGPNTFSASVQNPSITGGAPINNGMYYVNVTVNGCTGGTDSVSVTVNTGPAAPVVTTNSPICSGTNLNLVADTIPGAIYSWTGPNGFTSSLQSPVITNAPVAAAGTYSLIANNGCSSLPATASVTINPSPAQPVAGSNSPLCIGNTLNLTSTTPGGVTYSWTGPTGFTSISQDTSITSATVAATGTYTIVLTSGGCNSLPGKVAVTVNSTPATPVPSSNNPACTGNTLNLICDTIPGALYSWTGPNGFTASSQDSSIANVSLSAAGTYTVTANNGCASVPATTTVLVNPTPAAPAAMDNSPLCTGSSLNLFSSLIPSATYQWTGPNGFISYAQDTSIAAATVSANGTYTVTATLNGCTSNYGTVAAVVNLIPAIPTVTSNTPVCSGNTLTLFADTVAGATYSWTGPNGFTSNQQNPVLTNVATAATGTYSVTITTNACTGSAGTTSVTINPTPATPAPGNNGPVCVGSPINFSTPAVGSVTYSWTGPNSFSSTSQNPGILSTTSADSGSFSLTVTAIGCTSAPGLTNGVINSFPLTPSISSNSPVCAGSGLNLNTPSLTGGSFTWSGPNSFSSALQSPSVAIMTSADSGMYSMTVTRNGCTSPAGSADIAITPLPASPMVSSNGPVCSGSTLMLHADTIIGTTYSWTGPNGFTSTAQNPAIASATTSATGIYTVVVQSGGCSSSPDTITAIVTPPAAGPTVSSNSPVCAGSLLSLSATAGTGATYSWTGPNSFADTARNPSITAATVAAAGTYSVTYTLGGCTSAPSTLNVIVNPGPGAPLAGSNSPLCVGSGLNLTSNSIAGATYAWTGPNGFSSSLQNPAIPSATITEAGTYYVSVTVSGCTGSIDSTKVTVSTTPAIPVISSNSPLCNGTTLNLISNAVVGATYSWTGPNGFTSSSRDTSISPVTLADTGQYTLILNNGCPSLPISLNVNVYPVPAATAGSNSPVCVGSILNLTSNTFAGASYSWTGPNGFTATSQNPTIANATTAASGTYSVTLTSSSGCIGSPGTILVAVNNPPATPVISSNSTLCSGAALNLRSDTIAWATYSWTGPNGFTSATQDPTLSNATTSETGTYTLSVNNGCAGTPVTLNVQVNPTPLAPVVGSNSPICVGATLNLTSTSLAGATYSWTGPNGFNASIQNPNIAAATAAASGTYSVTLTSSSGCIGSPGTILVAVNNPPATPVVSSNSPLCSGAALNLHSDTIAGATYSWTGPNGFNSATQDPSILNATVSETGTYTLSVNNGCAGTPVTLNVQVNTTPLAPVVGSNSPLCVGSSLNLTSNTAGASAYIWTGPNSFNSNLHNPVIVNVSLADSGIYTVKASAGVCTSPSATIHIQISTGALVEAGNNQQACSGKTFVLSGTVSGAPNGTWSSSGNGIFSPSDTARNATYTPGSTDLSSGSATLILSTPASGTCAAVSDTVMLSINPLPVANFAHTHVCGTNPIAFMDASSISSGTFSIWNWKFGDSVTFTGQNASHAYTSSGIYTVTLQVTSAFGCSGSVSDTIQIENCGENGVFPPVLPEAFTPNGDGHNDILYVRGGPFKQMDFTVYNNWGNVIFHTNTQSQGWDGSYGGQPQPGGSYVWILVGETIDNQAVKKKGDVTLIR